MIYINDSFKGVWPVGVAAVVEADSAHEASKLLEAELRLRNLKQCIETKSMKPFTGGALIINDGDY